MLRNLRETRSCYLHNRDNKAYYCGWWHGNAWSSRQHSWYLEEDQQNFRTMTMSNSKLQTQRVLKDPSNFLKEVFRDILRQLISFPIWKFRAWSLKALQHNPDFNGHLSGCPLHIKPSAVFALAPTPSPPTNTPLQFDTRLDEKMSVSFTDMRILFWQKLAESSLDVLTAFLSPRHPLKNLNMSSF